MNTIQSKPAKKFLDWSSLRVRLVASYMFFVLIAFIVMGVYGSYNAQRVNSFFIRQLNENVYQQASNYLDLVSQIKALELNTFFINIQKHTLQIGKALEEMLSNEATIGSDNYWDAASALERLPNGSWDNNNNETASIFAPAKIELTENLITELNAARKLDFIVPSLLEANPDVVALYFGSAQGETIYYPNIDLATIVPADFDVTKRPWYLTVAPARNPQKQAVWSEPYLDAALNGLVITNSFPVYDQSGVFRGAIAMDIQLTRITDMIASINIGKTGYAFLLDKNRRIIAMPEAGYADLGISPETLPLGEVLEPQKLSIEMPQEFWALLNTTSSGASRLDKISINGVERLIVYRPIDEVNYKLIIIVPAEELLASAIAANEQIGRTARASGLTAILLSMGVLSLTLLLTLQIGNRLIAPLLALTKTAEEIERGNLNATASIVGSGEIGTLARAFDAMTSQLRDTITNLEQRVAERTRVLERRSAQMRAALEVGSAAVSVRELEILLTRITHLISQRFGFYHVGIFLLDERREYAVLRATNSRGGQAMLARGHKLKVGQEGIVGYVTGSGEARIALDVGEDRVYFHNPDLPETRSEATLPLVASGQIIGALDVQSTEESAFDEEDLVILRVLADQIAIALENARLLEQSRKSIEAIQRAYGESSRLAWQAIFEQSSRPLGYAATEEGRLVTLPDAVVSPEHIRAMESGRPILSEDQKLLYVPVLALGNVIGILKLKQKDDSRWTEQDVAAIGALAEQVGTALESARLYEQIRARARQEGIVSQITSRLRETLDIENILQTAAREIRRSLNLHEAEIRLQSLPIPESLSEQAPIKTSNQ